MSGPATALAITTHPTSIIGSNLIFFQQPVVRVVDVTGSLVTGDTSGVTASLVTVIGSGSLYGTLMKQASAGIADFSGNNLKIVGTGSFRILFSDGALTSSTSNDVEVPIMFDSFNRPDEFISLGTSDSGHVWSHFGDARYAVISNTAQPFQSVGINGGTSVNVGSANTKMTATMANYNGQQPGMIFRKMDDSNFWIWYKFDATGTLPATSSMRLARWNGLEVPVAGDTVILDHGDVWSISCDSSNLITLKINGNTIRTLTDSTYSTGTQYGISGYVNVNSAWDNFSVGLISSTPTKLGILTQPGIATSSVPFGIPATVEARDASDGLAFSYTGSITASIFSGSGVLSGTTAKVPTGGQATFTDLVVTGTGAKILQFTAPGLTSITSSVFNVATFIGPGTHLSMSVAPSTPTTSTISFARQPIISALDVNEVVSLYTGSIAASIASGSGTLTGTVSKSAVAGVATYTDLAIVGSGFHTIAFKAPGMTLTSAVVLITSSSLGLPFYYYFLNSEF